MSGRDGIERRRFDKWGESGTLLELIDLFVDHVSQPSVHRFNYKWQGQQFESCKKNILPGDVVQVVDFAENFSHKVQGQAQSAHWSTTQTTMVPFVMYYKCQRCLENIKKEILVLSNDLEHTLHQVRAFEGAVLDHLCTKGVEVKRLFRWSDNCAGQFKSFKVFDLLSNVRIPTAYHYFGAKHGKSEGDSLIG